MGEPVNIRFGMERQILHDFTPMHSVKQSNTETGSNIVILRAWGGVDLGNIKQTQLQVCLGG